MLRQSSLTASPARTQTPQAPDPPARTPDGDRGRWSTWQRAIAAAVPALLIVSALFVWMTLRAHAGTDAAGLQMPAMDLNHRVGYWWTFLMGDTLGIAALIWAYLAVLVGLLYSTNRVGALAGRRRQLNDLHRQLSITTLLLIGAHIVFVAIGSMNNQMNARTVDIPAALVPFQVSYNEWPYAYGIFAFYLSLIIGPSYYIRKRLGVRAWRIAHRLTLAVYVLSVVHTMYFDDFSFDGPYCAALWIAQIPLAGALLWRLAPPAW